MTNNPNEDPGPPDPSPPSATLQEYAPYPYQSLNSDGEILTVNDAWIDRLGYEREEVEGRWFGQFLVNDSVDVFESRFPEFKSTGRVSNVELEIRCADGELILISYGGTIEYDDDGSVIRTHSQFQAITEWKQYKTFVENSPDVILLHDETGKAKYVSPAVEREMGYEPESLQGRNQFEDVHPEDRDRMMEAFGRMLSDPEKVLTEEFRIQDADGSYVWVESRGQNLSDEKGINGILLNSRVIEERKEYEKKLERQNERLDEFASGISHDLRNPLNVAEGRIELALEECDTEHLDAAADGIERSLELIDDMLDLARAGQEVSKTEPVSVADLVDVCWGTVETPDATVITKTELTIRADKTRLRQLFENLFRNAVEHGSEDVTVSVGSLPEGFFVEDDGPGIPEDERGDVWESGYSGSEEGTGFGLSIVKQIVDAHGWDIRITEGSGGGARFEITGVEFAD